MSKRALPLRALLDSLPQYEIEGDAARAIGALAIDSRAVEPGALFVALRGERTDGHRYASEALARGAAAVVVEAPVELSGDAKAMATVVRVADTKRALSRIAAAFYGEPSHALNVIGVTGTNGKTTTVTTIAKILERAGIGCGTIGTVGAALETKSWQLSNTTPLAPELHELLARMRDDGAKAVAMEVSSHALALERVDDVRFFAGVLTNVTRDHLDFHGTLEDYRASKRRLFAMTERCVLNGDDECGAAWAQELAREGRHVVTYGLRSGAQMQACDVVADTDRLSFNLDGETYELHLTGRFNVYNALAAIAVARLLGVPDDVSAGALLALDRVPGRMERVRGRSIDVVVDYAHTPDALDNALRALRETTAGRLAVVFGCGGDRDRGKRPQMGEVAARLADRVYITSDNPRSESPQAIVDEIRAGIPTAAKSVVEEVDRRAAIARAIAEAQPRDVVLVAGKGHETYQIVGERVLPFDDVAVARELLA